MAKVVIAEKPAGGDWVFVMNTTALTLRVIVGFITIAMLMLAADLHRMGNDLASAAVLTIDGAILLESILFDRGGYRPRTKIK